MIAIATLVITVSHCLFFMLMTNIADANGDTQKHSAAHLTHSIEL